MNYAQVLNELETLVTETFGLWEHNRVGFQWRHYTWNHTMRVRAMSMELGRREGGDIKLLEVAGTLHDITKRYDGVILTDDNGKRILDHNGFWLNEMLTPARKNIVTELYEKHNLQGKVHHESGAVITENILAMYDFEPAFVEAATAVVLAHLKPMNLTAEDFKLLYGSIENQILYDADTMDPNVGYTGFFRNIHIHAYFALQRGNFDLEEYVRNLPRWINSKQEFVDKLLTESSREVGQIRQDRNQRLFAQMVDELDDMEINRKYGLLGVIEYFVSETEDPHFANQLNYLQTEWLPQRQQWIAEEEKSESARERAQAAVDRVNDFLTLFEQESRGEFKEN
ncbi:MAG: HD domain-containing protein [Candidatus Poribacteria bacterium]|nr:HD domain-containing protein [Candidatus Poribacteria bacterium]